MQRASGGYFALFFCAAWAFEFFEHLFLAPATNA
jgi:hypothetical protein